MSLGRPTNNNDIFGYNPKTRLSLYASRVFFVFLVALVMLTLFLFNEESPFIASCALVGGLLVLVLITELFIIRAKMRAVEFHRKAQVVRIVSFWFSWIPSVS